MPLDAATRDRRMQNLHRAAAAAELDAVAIVPGSNFQYLTGGRFASMERPTVIIVPTEGDVRVVLPFFEEASWEHLGVAAEVHLWKDIDGYDGAFAAAVTGLAVKRLGVEGQKMRVFEEMALTRQLPKATVVDAHAAISSIRLIKDKSEIDALRRAIKISEAALEKTLKEVRVGATEREVESVLIRAMYAGGADGLAFPPIVVAGAKAAEPHGHVGGYRIQRGDTLLFDFGAAVGGYNADITRTVFVGEPDAEARRFYETVEEANRVGRAAAKPGVTAGALDDTVQRFLEASPFAAHILHKTGHGLGLDVHEAPQVMRGVNETLKPGMVFTIEPGLYVSGLRGVRTEDNVVVTDNGIDSLTTFPRELRVIA